MIAIQFDIPRFGREMNELAALLHLSNGEIVTRTSRLWLGDCVRATPPTGRGTAATNTTVQRKLGEGRIKNDLRIRAFPLLERLKLYREDDDLGRRLRILAGQGKYRELTVALRNLGVSVSQVVAGPTRSLHQPMRSGKTGRVRKGSPPHWTVFEGRREAYIDQVLERLGQAKGGWGTAASRLRVTLPGWAKRHAGRQLGHFSGIRDRARPSIEFGNGVSYIQGSFYETKIMKATGRFRERQMKLEAEKLWRFARNDNLASIRARTRKAAFTATEAVL